MDEPTRRAWSKPELIVLVRSGPEEAVLLTCKGQVAVSGPTDYHGFCLKTPGGAGYCDWCSNMVSS